ncbi:TPA: hypothetical protein ACGJVD_001806 [Pseudomonas aeruginosa]|uniref:hypothetical protein n=1 Tax=Pseudomonas aeruginosa TaxID=287 RepID=UPI0012985B03|nr:hypothetical protein [Pseudomonas aeruginosa]
MEVENKDAKKKNSKYKTKNTTLISLRMLNEDIIKLNEIVEVSNIKKSELIRSLIRGNPVTLVEYANKELIEKYDIIYDIFKNVGSNINQIAIKLNQGQNINNKDIETLTKISNNLEVLNRVLKNKTIITKKEI